MKMRMDEQQRNPRIINWVLPLLIGVVIGLILIAAIDFYWYKDKSVIATLARRIAGERVLESTPARTPVANLEALRVELKSDMLQLQDQLTLLKWMVGVVLLGMVSLLLRTFFMN